MNATKMFGLMFTVVLVLLAGADAAQAQAVNASFGGNPLKAVGAGLVLIGAAYGFGKIGAAALESMARQPEVANKVQTAMIIIGALLEGATFFALIVCMQASV